MRSVTLGNSPSKVNLYVQEAIERAKNSKNIAGSKDYEILLVVTQGVLEDL